MSVRPVVLAQDNNMTRFSYTLGRRRHSFDDLKALMAKASSPKSGDQLAGIAAGSDEERVAA
ncbi:MAG: ethanolamine ammonia-lyase subunit EutB, partial [Candidatus Methylophosphatis roskildensis]